MAGHPACVRSAPSAHASGVVVTHVPNPSLELRAHGDGPCTCAGPELGRGGGAFASAGVQMTRHTSAQGRVACMRRWACC